MIQIETLIKRIIPYPADHSHREGFSNKTILDSLKNEEKKQVEIALIDLLNEHQNDTLIVETLAYMKSEKSIPILRDLLEKCTQGYEKLSIATSIFEINQDITMADIVIAEFKQYDKKDAYYSYNIMAAFYYLSRFQIEKTNKLIGEFIDHEDYLISYNAKRFFVDK